MLLLSTWSSVNYIVCTLHPGLVSISFNAISICPSTIDNFLNLLLSFFVCFQQRFVHKLSLLHHFAQKLGTMMAYLEVLSMFTVHHYSPLPFFHVYTCMCIYPDWQNETDLILSLWLAGLVWHTDLYVYPMFKNLLNHDYCQNVCRWGVVTMPARTG